MSLYSTKQAEKEKAKGVNDVASAGEGAGQKI